MQPKEELKSVLMAVQTTDLHPLNWLFKLWDWKTSEQTSASTAKMAQALAAVDFVGTYTYGLGQARVWVHP